MYSFLHPSCDLHPAEFAGRDQVLFPKEFCPTEGDIQDLKLYVKYGGEKWEGKHGGQIIYIPYLPKQP